MRIWNYNKEAKEKARYDVYFKFGMFGAFVAAMLIFGMKLFIFGVNLLIKYWIWILVIMACAFLVKHFLSKRRSK